MREDGIYDDCGERTVVFVGVLLRQSIGIVCYMSKTHDTTPSAATA